MTDTTHYQQASEAQTGGQAEDGRSSAPAALSSGRDPRCRVTF